MKSNDDRLNENFAMLYGAIFKQAVEDDYRQVCKLISEKLISNGVGERRASDYIRKNSQFIKEKIRKDVHQEALNYGYGTKKIKMNHINSLVEKMVSGFGKEVSHDKQR